MKKAFAVFCALVLMPGLNAQAWVGGPWSNNNFEEQTGDDGIYEAVATMTNGTGMYRWAVRNKGVGSSATAPDANTATTPQASNVLFGGGMLGSASSNVWYYRGILYYGTAFGIVNSAMGMVMVTANASTNGGAGLTAGLNNQFISGPNPGGDDTPITTAPPAAGSVVSPAANSTGNIGYANSTFAAKIKSKAPVKRFSGSGMISFTGAPDTTISLLQFSTTTVPSGSFFAETKGSTGGESADFPQRGHKRSFKVMGTQVSTQVLP